MWISRLKFKSLNWTSLRSACILFENLENGIDNIVFRHYPSNHNHFIFCLWYGRMRTHFIRRCRKRTYLCISPRSIVDRTYTWKISKKPMYNVLWRFKMSKNAQLNYWCVLFEFCLLNFAIGYRKKLAIFVEYNLNYKG